MGDYMKKIINLFSLLLLFSVASSQANVFRRAAKRALNRVSFDTLLKLNKGADIALAGMTASCIYSVYKTVEAHNQLVTTLKRTTDATKETIDAAGDMAKKIRSLRIAYLGKTPEQARQEAIEKMKSEGGPIKIKFQKIVSYNGREVYDKENDPFYKNLEEANKRAEAHRAACDRAIEILKS
jgi:hypothetical protein